jgi:hypothetical protein
MVIAQPSRAIARVLGAAGVAAAAASGVAACASGTLPVSGTSQPVIACVIDDGGMCPLPDAEIATAGVSDAGTAAP